MNIETADTRELSALLAWYIAMGADEAADLEPVDRFVIPEPVAKPQKGQQQERSRPTPIQARPAKPAIGAGIEAAEKAAAACTNVEELEATLKAFDGGMLKRSSKNTVFADGKLGADLMIIGEAPGAYEDRDGKPFIGPNGDMLEKMLTAIGLKRDEHVYLSDVLPWRPLGNTKPDDATIAMCLPFLKKHIELAKPKYLLLMGVVSAQAVLGTKDGISRLRGKWKDIEIGGQTFAAMATYHPSYLMAQPQMKGATWRDLLAVKERLES
ncbi:uracil-DNA glycosylase [Kordiimonas laminariae]|uniref:uracil-DNA glycosylase n=1 Tax=Kordiimonas laminariae TaxID=2917717 RepID=UPI001FF3F974|nr:uracil-DNA glycosylase [Kordiimonas laminariae]MCK0068591.1 uracil-DNA glycosylase [Kordiimonas laminariae]